MNDKLQQGAQAAINQCLEVTNEDRVIIVTDFKTNHIGKSLEHAATQITSNVKTLLIEDYVERPAKEFPQKMQDEIKEFNPTVAIYAAQGQAGELPLFRSKFVDFVAYQLGCRYAHMINITEQLMEDGMNKDYDQVYKVTNRLAEILKDAELIKVTDPHGTNITFTLDKEKVKWIPSHGKIRKGSAWQNLPSGEIFTTPIDANGIFIAWVLGDNLSEKYGELETPMVVKVTNGRISEVEALDSSDHVTQNAVRDFKEYIKQEPLSDLIGELGIGTLIGLDHFVGNLLQDEKYPGCHIAFGYSYPETGISNDCMSHIDIIAKNVDIVAVINGADTILMRNGVFEDFVLN